jgi:hypothetical protein
LNRLKQFWNEMRKSTSAGASRLCQQNTALSLDDFHDCAILPLC